MSQAFTFGGQTDTMTEHNVAAHSTARLDRVEGNLRVGKKARLESATGKITVSEGVYFEGGVDVNCSLECDTLRVDHFGVVRIAGDLTVHSELDIIHSIEVSGAINAGAIIGEGKIRSNSVAAKKIRANGVMEVKKELITEESIDVTGKLDAPGHVKLHDFSITGKAVVGAGEISGKIEVRGDLEVASPIEFGELQVFGSTRLPSGCRGKKTTTFGKLEVNGDFQCDQIEAQGATKVHGDCVSTKAWVRGKLEVSKSLSIADVLETFGTTEVAGKYTGCNLRVAGKLIADEAVLTGEADIAGRVEVKQGLKARSVIIRSGSRCETPIVAKVVDVGQSYANVVSFQTGWMGQNVSMRLIGRESRVSDVYGTNIHLGAASRAGRIFAGNVQLEKGCVVDRITYTGELKLPDDPKSTYINHPPEKVEKLPNPPF